MQEILTNLRQGIAVTVPSGVSDYTKLLTALVLILATVILAVTAVPAPGSVASGGAILPTMSMLSSFVTLAFARKSDLPPHRQHLDHNRETKFYCSLVVCLAANGLSLL